MAAVSDAAETRNRRLARSTLVVMLAFGLAKAISLVQVKIIADTFGVGRDWDTYVAADSVSGLIFTLISGGALAHAFIPIFSSFLAREDRDGAWKIASHVTNSIFLATLLVSLIVFIFAMPLAGVIAPGFDMAAREQTANLLRVLLLSTLIFSVSGIVMGVLQSYNHFLTPALAPVLLDVGILIGVLFFIAPMGVYGIAWGTVLGALMHLGIQVPALLRYHPRWLAQLGWRDPVLWHVFRLMLPRIAGLGLFLYNFQLAINIASRMNEGAVSAFSWGWRLMQIPETLIGTAIGTVVFPTLAALSELNDEKGKRDAMSGALRFILVTTIPASVGLILVGRPLISLLEGGAFDPSATALVYSTLSYFTLGLIVHSLLEVASRSFYADKNTLVPLWTALGGAVINVVFSLALTGMPLTEFLSPAPTVVLDSARVGYLALANSLGTAFQVGVLLWLLGRRWHGINESMLARTTLKTAAASLIMGLAVGLVDAAWNALGLGGRGTLMTAVQAGVLMLTGAGVFVGAALALKMDEVRMLLNLFVRRKKAVEVVA
ncbi:MAG: murein biosynthesis integral membrane protein MurJ [Chloroflexi bacterium]|nr:murein biosynthesis integral membrane protein MurJ [Chloroflexota bacterium]